MLRRRFEKLALEWKACCPFFEIRDQELVLGEYEHLQDLGFTITVHKVLKVNP